MNIKTLIKKVVGEVKPDRFGDVAIMFGRNEPSENYASLSESTMLETEEIRNSLNRLIPDDFEYNVWIEDGVIDLIIMYYDGIETGVNLPLSIDLAGDYKKNLLEVNWDEQRQFCIPTANSLDNLLDKAKDLPRNLPSTAESQILHHHALRKFLEMAEAKKIKYGVAAYSSNELGYEMTSHKQRKYMLGDLCDFLTFRWPIIAVIDHGQLLNIRDTEKLKFEVVEGLGKISKALALGQLGTA